MTAGSRNAGLRDLNSQPTRLSAPRTSTPSMRASWRLHSPHEHHRARRRPHRPRARGRAPRGARDDGDRHRRRPARGTLVTLRRPPGRRRRHHRAGHPPGGGPGGPPPHPLPPRQAGVESADLFIGCSPREEANLVGAMLVKRLSGAQTIVRTTSTAYLDAWRERHLDVDFMVSPELETANAISTTLGLPAARQTDIFADGKVQIVEFDVPPHAPRNTLVGRTLRSAEMPPDSKVAAIIRGELMIVPRGDEQI